MFFTVYRAGGAVHTGWETQIYSHPSAVVALGMPMQGNMQGPKVNPSQFGGAEQIMHNCRAQQRSIQGVVQDDPMFIVKDCL